MIFLFLGLGLIFLFSKGLIRTPIRTPETKLGRTLIVDSNTIVQADKPPVFTGVQTQKPATGNILGNTGIAGGSGLPNSGVTGLQRCPTGQILFGTRCVPVSVQSVEGFHQFLLVYLIALT